MVIDTTLVDNSTFVVLILSVVFMTIYSFVISDKQNYTDIMLSFFAGVISFIVGLISYNGINYVFGGTVDVLTWQYQSSSVGAIFIILGVIMILLGIAKIYDVVKDASEEIKL